MSKVLELRKELLRKETELLNSENPEYKTSCMFRPSMYSQRGQINIKVASVGEILEAYKAIKLHKEAAKDLGLDTKHLSYPVNDWVSDFKTRISVINREKTLAEVAKLKAELDPLMTTKEKRQVGIEDLTNKIQELE